jgi:hypothetical protein
VQPLISSFSAGGQANVELAFELLKVKVRTVIEFESEDK